MSLSTAIDNLVAKSVTGITTRFKPSNAPDGFIADADLPATVLQLANTGGQGFTSGNVDHSEGVLVCSVVDLVLVAGVGQVLSQNEILTAVDNYLDALKDDHFLSNALDKPTLIILERIGSIPYGNSVYQGCVFRHMWHVRYS